MPHMREKSLFTHSKPHIVHRASIAELMPTTTSGNFVPQIRQRDVGTKALDQRGLVILRLTSARLAGEANNAVGMIA